MNGIVLQFILCCISTSCATVAPLFCSI